MIICENCNQGNKGNYRSIWLEKEDRRYKPPRIIRYLETWCYDCLGTGSTADKDKQMFEHISTPFWQHMGLKPNKKEAAKLKYLKDHNMTWGDERRMREAGLEKKNLALGEYQKHIEKYGSGGKPDVEVKKENR